MQYKISFMKTIIRTLVTATFVCGFAMYAQAQYLNGTLQSSFYGSPLEVQTANTGFGYAGGGADSAGGSELDAAYGTISGGDLWLFLAGNFESNGNHLNLFIAGGAAGQNTLSTSGGTLAAMNGSVFSPGFQATFALDMNDYSPSEGVTPGTLYTEEYNLVLNTGGYVGVSLSPPWELQPEATAAYPAFTSTTTTPAQWVLPVQP